ncbi:MAG: hypothetical protein DI530_11845 [Sphingomonas sp.]|uniref:O-antigen ligase family protein n=1 Tax=Sphingomonas sp. TaxID=28214 RepID=UPI000DBBBEC6|nr:O-antigen ligase family protein [Sphingomonas sp.]PZU77925.1 MAG: hypothetical protein DI530_11845 [Sphingomonas sp.]
MSASKKRHHKPQALFWIALSFLVLAAFTGGASRIDTPGLVLLKPAAVLLCGLAAVTLRRSQIESYRWIFLGFGAIMVVSLLQLIPLPPAVWRTLPGRDELARVDTIAGISGAWRPLTLTPMNGWHAFTALFVPLAMLLLAVQLDRRDLQRLLPVVLVLAGISGLIGLLQVVGGGSESLYLYRGTNNGTAAGLFANRNHAALLLAMMFPMLAAWAMTGNDGKDRTRHWLRSATAVAAGVVLLPMILVTGSRSGLLLCVPGLLAAVGMFAYWSPDHGVVGRHRRLIVAGGVMTIGALLLGLLSLYLSKGDAIRRLTSTSSGSEFRVDIWTTSLKLFWKYFPVGSGIGSFVEAYQVIEPYYQLNATFRNHAHLDFLEIGICLGVPGVVILIGGAIAYIRRSYRVWTARADTGDTIRFARMASIAIAMIAAASIVDYPMRTPFMMCIAVLLSLWLAQTDQPMATTSHRRHRDAAEN